MLLWLKLTDLRIPLRQCTYLVYTVFSLCFMCILLLLFVVLYMYVMRVSYISLNVHSLTSLNIYPTYFCLYYLLLSRDISIYPLISV
jgi:hypothetical protein